MVKKLTRWAQRVPLPPLTSPPNIHTPPPGEIVLITFQICVLLWNIVCIFLCLSQIAFFLLCYRSVRPLSVNIWYSSISDVLLPPISPHSTNTHYRHPQYQTLVKTYSITLVWVVVASITVSITVKSLTISNVHVGWCSAFFTVWSSFILVLDNVKNVKRC